ncbi:electron transport complex subunit RsxC [Vibrio breoganii]|uniref:electron transport complex subunit RsxC n=2 Tax=Vibrio breoganii TaxID=553239 RepID=UPI000C8201A9|nr:electron transport complex subunit RsxC [Vibrio breoganii]PMJ44066.1 electron transport complex subunit RsxC [Vibrio breoganii]PMK60551.1 electron transport complex subunit RsxC [Vibrio breoganii]PMO27521.1 electron transport complex subunit RsxC [Vibrio breoganii]PMO30365.1 electron transport complex subunit RsxC [Vibrio breoganii]PMO66697.1 electron transport complex subunit RsxC [Vibrio breoganii]
MLSLIEQIRSGHLWDFPGGIHPPEHKAQSLTHKIGRANIANEIVIPVKQHIGKEGDLLVKVGDSVLKGQPLTQYHTSLSLPVHASTSGVVTAIEPRTGCHPSGLPELSIVIKPDQKDTWIEHSGITNYQELSAEELVNVIRQAGISGMGGAGFPTARKLQSGFSRTDILIINAAECEPYITADDSLMREYAEQVIQGIEILSHILKPKLCIIGIEDNKPEAIQALNKAGENHDIVIRVIPTKYPSGGERQLIKVLTDKEVPSSGLPADIGIMVQNVGSAFAVKRAVIDGEPLIERVVTMTGGSVSQAQNLWVPIGTPVQSLLEQAHFSPWKKQSVIMGGPMMGFTLPHTQVPITKTSNCILAPAKRELEFTADEMACIRCGQCAEACPASLLPQQMYWYSKDKDLEKCEEYKVKDCIECGACAYVCPSNIPLVNYFRQSKTEIKIQAAEAEAAERAKVRFEQRKERLERDKIEREQKYKIAAEKRRSQMKTEGGDDAIAAAIERVKQKKTEGPKPAVAAAIARAKAKQAEAQSENATEPDNSEMRKLREQRKEEARLRREQKADQQPTAAETKSDAVAAAIARAKAKKEQLASTNSETSDAKADKQDAVKAAIERAKARKAAQASAQSQTSESADLDDSNDSNDSKNSAVAAAVARAKARKAQQQATDTEPKADESAESDDPKKAAVAAAVARAKARKAQQQTTDTEPKADEPVESDDPKKAAVAAAVARAKARKAQQQAADTEPEASESAGSDDPKKAAVAAAVARAKARKAQQQTADTEPKASESAESDDPKKAAVAAAIARAKARKAQQQQTTENEPEASEPAESDDPKKAAVAAAIARAKARKAAAQADSSDSKENN